MSGYKAIDTPLILPSPNLGELTYQGGGQFNPSQSDLQEDRYYPSFGQP